MNKFNQPFSVIPGFSFYKVLIKFADPLLPLPNETLSDPVDPALRFFWSLLELLTPYNVDEENVPWDKMIGGS